MRIDKMVKDKRILLKGEGYLAIVEYYQDTPARDNDTPDEQMFVGLKEARKWLARFPRDVWDGFANTENRYREVDERHRNGKRFESTGVEDRRTGKALCFDQGAMRNAGRSVVGSMRGVH